MLTLCLGAPSSLTPLINDSCFTTVANRQLSTGADGFDRTPTQESWRLSQTEPYIPSHLRSESCESIRQEKWGSCHPLLTCWISGLTEKPYGTPVWSPLWIVCAVLGLSAPDLIPPQGGLPWGRIRTPPPSCRILPVESMLAVGVELFLCSSSSVPFFHFLLFLLFPSNLGDVHTRGEGAFLADQIWVCWRQQTQISNARQLQPLQPLQPL